MIVTPDTEYYYWYELLTLILHLTSTWHRHFIY